MIRKLVRSRKLYGYVETSAKNGGPEIDKVFHDAVLSVVAPDHVQDCTDEGANEYCTII